MKTGIELIADERKEQIEKHGRSVECDVKFNSHYQLTIGAELLIQILNDSINEDMDEYDECPEPPFMWDRKLWDKMCRKPYKERLIIAGALIAAEIDRLQNL
jgi:hypothetical protein